MFPSEFSKLQYAIFRKKTNHSGRVNRNNNFLGALDSLNSGHLSVHGKEISLRRHRKSIKNHWRDGRIRKCFEFLWEIHLTKIAKTILDKQHIFLANGSTKSPSTVNERARLHTG